MIKSTLKIDQPVIIQAGLAGHIDLYSKLSWYGAKPFIKTRAYDMP